MRQEKQTTKQNSTSTESSKIEKDEFACNKCKPNYIFALRSCTKYSAVLFLGVKKKKRLTHKKNLPISPKNPISIYLQEWTYCSVMNLQHCSLAL
jgi:hypothetical protein